MSTPQRREERLGHERGSLWPSFVVRCRVGGARRTRRSHDWNVDGRAAVMVDSAVSDIEQLHRGCGAIFLAGRASS
jgi:hypothetical protein